MVHSVKWFNTSCDLELMKQIKQPKKHQKNSKAKQ